jgi:hypothetical protein
MTTALIVPAAGTVVYRDDGSVAIVDRNRQQYEIAAELVAAIVRLANSATQEEA